MCVYFSDRRRQLCEMTLYSAHPDYSSAGLPVWCRMHTKVLASMYHNKTAQVDPGCQRVLLLMPVARYAIL
jgi:hypothetical protein